MTEHASRHRVCGAAVLLTACVIGIVGIGPSAAAHSEPTGSTTSTTVAAAQDPPVLYGTTTVSGATVTTPGAPTRTLDANQMTAFVQTWLAYSVYENPPNEAPPPGVPVSRLAAQLITAQIGPVETEFLYATDGTTVWVGAVQPPVMEEKWIRAPDAAQTTKAFEGRLEPLRDPIAPSTTIAPTTTVPPEKPADDGTTSTVAVGVVAAVAVVVAVAVGLVWRARRRAPSDT